MFATMIRTGIRYLRIMPAVLPGVLKRSLSRVPATLALAIGATVAPVSLPGRTRNASVAARTVPITAGRMAACWVTRIVSVPVGTPYSTSHGR